MIFKNKWFVLLLLVLIGGASFFLFLSRSKMVVAQSLELETFKAFIEAVPDRDLVDLDHEGIDQKKIYILDFWATWCPPCRAEIPHFISLQNQFSDQIQIIGVSVDQNPRDLERYLTEQSINYPIVANAPFKDYLLDAFGPIYSLPTTFFLSETGEVLLRVDGYRDLDFLQSKVEEFL